MIDPQLHIHPHSHLNSGQLISELEQLVDGITSMEVDSTIIVTGPHSQSEDASYSCTEDTDGSKRCHSQGEAPTTAEISYNQTLNRKRAERTSPFPSPLKLTKSPAPKRVRRPRTGTEQQHSTLTSEPSLHRFSDGSKDVPVDNASRPDQHPYSASLKDKTLSDFLMSEEAEALTELKDEINTYMFQKVTVNNKKPQKTFLNIQDYFSVTRPNHTEKSNVLYLKIMDAIADSKDTMMAMLHDLHKQYIEEQHQQWLLVEGDAKVYEILKALKFEYGEELKWLIPYPGDWHMLKNYQSALMAAYYDAGLKALANASGYPLAQLQGCSNFKRTHHFLLEVWEAVYRAMLAKFFEAKDIKTSNTLQQKIIESLEALNPMPDSERNFSKAFNSKLADINKTIGALATEFSLFVKKRADEDDTWKFWRQFVFQDAMAYVGQFLAMRSGDWYLRLASVKLMAPVFTAFDHSTYQKVISQHLADILCMPPPILAMFQQGAFVVSVCGRTWHSVAIDEAHEMLINKQCKTSMSRPTEDYINRVAHYIPYRTKALENLRHQLFPEATPKLLTVESPFSLNRNDHKFEQNVKVQVETIQSSSLFETTIKNRGLFNPFTNQKATQQQSHDLLNFRQIGQEDYELRIAYFILRQPSVEAPNRKRRMQTFSVRQVKTRRVSQLEKDKRLILAAMKKKMQYSKKTGRPIDKPGEQLLEYPVALCDHDGKLLKGQKSYTTNSLEARYKTSQPPVFTAALPTGWRGSWKSRTWTRTRTRTWTRTRTRTWTRTHPKFRKMPFSVEDRSTRVAAYCGIACLRVFPGVGKGQRSRAYLISFNNERQSSSRNIISVVYASVKGWSLVSAVNKCSSNLFLQLIKYARDL